MFNHELFTVRPRWRDVASIVSKRLGKVYAPNYVQQVASGCRINKRVEAILRELEIMQDDRQTEASQTTPNDSPETVHPTKGEAA